MKTTSKSRIADRKRLARPAATIVRPPVKRAALLAGTALATGVLASLAGIATPTPAEAACAIINPSPAGPTDLGFYQVVCGGKITTEVSYNDGIAPLLTSDTTFDADLHLTTVAPVVTGTFIKSQWDGIDIDGTNSGNNYNIVVYVDNATAIWSGTEVVQVQTGDDSEDGAGNINITSNGFLSNQGGSHGAQNGIDATSTLGNITIVNNGMVGVNFIPGLDFVGGSFVDANNGNAVVTLTNGSAFTVPAWDINGPTPTSAGAITGDGINAQTADGAIDVQNFGTVWSLGAGISATATGNGTISLSNLSTSSIHSGGNGLEAFGAGGAVNIWNGDGSLANPDGLIIANEDGIHANNTNGGIINVYNGNLTLANQTSSNSQIYAWGNYGIYAYSHADGVIDGIAPVNVFNYGLVQLQSDGQAGVYVRSSADADGYAAFFNGAADVTTYMAPNARVNAYMVGTEGGSLLYDDFDADGVQIVKFGGAGGLPVTVVSEDAEFNFVGLPFGAVVRNYGMWDFTRDDNYLTPGFAEGTAVASLQTGTTGGIYAPAGSAFRITHYGSDNTLIWNDGTAIGQGNRWDPVVSLKTSYDSVGGDTEEGNFILVYNGTNGVMGSANTPYNWQVSLSQFQQIGFGFLNNGITDTDWDFIEQSVGPGGLSLFAEAAGDRLLQSNWGSGFFPGGPGGARLLIWNQGLMIGQMRINSDFDAQQGTEFVNGGAWFVTGHNQFWGSNDVLENYGLVQTAFDNEDGEFTAFHFLNLFENYGVLSMIDTPVGSTLGNFDRTWTGGDYWGGGTETVDSRGYLAVDTYFGAIDGDGPVGSDRLYVAGDIGGSTGVIVHKLNTTPGFISDEDGILVARVYGDDLNAVQMQAQNQLNVQSLGSACYDVWCKDGDTMFISELSQNYLNINGIGFIQDGIFIHGIKEVGEAPDPDFIYASAYGPAATDQPSLITGAQSAFYETSGSAEDHQYGNVYPIGGQGGGGADMAYGPQPAHGMALWGKATGSWSNRDSTVVSAGIPIDTSFSQDVQSLIAGIELRPQGGDSGWRFGAFGGGIWSNLKFDSFGGSAKYSGGTLGAYAAYFNGPWHADAELKTDFLGVSYSSAAVSASTNATNVGLLANLGYRMENGRMFFEPQGSFALVNTALGGTSAGGATISYSNGQSVRAGIGARVGMTVGDVGGAKVDFDVLGKLWNEFGSPNTVTVSDGTPAGTTSFTDPISGLFGEVVARGTVYSADRTLSGYASVGGKFGSGWSTYTAKAGVRKNF